MNEEHAPTPKALCLLVVVGPTLVAVEQQAKFRARVTGVFDVVSGNRDAGDCHDKILIRVSYDEEFSRKGA